MDEKEFRKLWDKIGKAALKLEKALKEAEEKEKKIEYYPTLVEAEKHRKKGERVYYKPEHGYYIVRRKRRYKDVWRMRNRIIDIVGYILTFIAGLIAGFIFIKIVLWWLAK